jgi:hypothetical protein
LGIGRYIVLVFFRVHNVFFNVWEVPWDVPEQTTHIEKAGNSALEEPSHSKMAPLRFLLSTGSTFVGSLGYSSSSLAF